MEIGDWITLGAVIVALGIGVASILHTRSLQKREHKDRLLNEIIEWATDIIRVSWGFGQAIKEAIKPATEKEQQLFKYAHVAEVKERFMQFTGKNVYITTVASTFTKSAKRLQEEIKVLDKDLVAYILFLDSWQRELQSNITNDKSDKDENSEKADEYVRSINISANKVIEETTKIKTKDIGNKEEDMSKEDEATGSKEPTLKDIEKHLKRQDRQMNRATYFTGAIFGSSIVIGAGFLWITRLVSSNAAFLWNYFFFVIAGFGFVSWCWYKQRKFKG